MSACVADRVAAIEAELAAQRVEIDEMKEQVRQLLDGVKVIATREAGRMTDGRLNDAGRYRLAQVNKIIRMGLVELVDGEIVETPPLAEMDPGPITPDPIDFDAVARKYPT